MDGDPTIVPAVMAGIAFLWLWRRRRPASGTVQLIELWRAGK